MIFVRLLGKDSVYQPLTKGDLGLFIKWLHIKIFEDFLPVTPACAPIPVVKLIRRNLDLFGEKFPNVNSKFTVALWKSGV